MADVAQKVISANDLHNNRVAVGTCPKNARIQTKENGRNVIATVTEMETKLTDRYDDRLWYSC